MTSIPDTHTRNPPRARRLSTCYLHPADPATGICASCLRERLYGLDSPGDPEPSFSSGNVGGGTRPISCLDNAAVTSPELRRCRSVFTAKYEASTSSLEPRRKSCDVGARNGKSLAHLFDVDDECNGSNGASKVESKNILRRPAVELREENKVKNGEEIRDFDGNEDDPEDENVEGEFKTMKEHIDLELQRKGQKLKDFKELAGSFWEAASVFSKKLQKWRHKQKKKLSNEGGMGDGNSEMNDSKEKKFGETQSELAEYGMGRRSCDTEPRFSVDGGRISFDEPRASWDGYLIARTIPRLAPMLSVVENAILNSGNRIDNHRVSVDGGQMHSIMEDESSSGGSAQSQSNSDSSSSQRRSSFDRSSSVRSFGKKFVGLEGDEMKYGLNARASPAKLVITEKELKDWHLNSMKDVCHRKKIESPCDKDATVVDDGGHLGLKKQVRWRKMWNVFGSKQKPCENKFDKSMEDSLDCSPAQVCEKQEKEVDGETIDGIGWKLMRSSSIVGARRSCEVIRSSNSMMNLADESECVNKGREDFVLGRNQSAKYTSSNLDDGVLPFYLTPLRSSRGRKSGRNKLQNSHFFNGHILPFN